MNTNRGTFDRQLGTLRDQVAQMGDMVQQSISLSVCALQNQDMALAKQIDQSDSQVNARRFAVEERAYQLLAMQQPCARDMRTIVGLVTTITNLERIGDHAAGIARLTLRLGEHPVIMPLPLFGAMAITDQWLLRNSVTAFVTQDEELAQTVIDRDSEVDQMHRDAYQQLLTTMAQNPDSIEAGTMMLWVSHNLERIGDRASNIAVRVSYLTKGELIRHPDPQP